MNNGQDKLENVYEDEHIRRYIYFRKIPRYKHPIRDIGMVPTQYECPLCMKIYDKKQDAIDCCIDLKPKWLKYLKEGRHLKYGVGQIGFMCYSCHSHFLGNCKCRHGGYIDDCEQCW